ncbi:MAG: type IV pilus assembly protein PilM [bacterium]
MGFFSRQSNSFVGVDIGTASLKVVELEDKGGKAHLKTYGITQIPNDLIRSESDKVVQEIAEALKKTMQQARVSSKQAITALPGFSIFTVLLDLPKIPEKELPRAIKFEAEKHIPGATSEMVLDWEIVNEGSINNTDTNSTTKVKEFYKILLTAAPKKLVNRYLSIFQKAGLKLDSLEPESMSLVRSLVGVDPNPVMLIDMGATATDIIIVLNGSPHLTRSIDIGGNVITDSISKSLNISVERAEQFKKDMGVNHQADEGIPQTIIPVAERIVTEVKRINNIFSEKEGGKIVKVVLSGGSAKLPGFANMIAKATDTKAYIGDPWARVVYPDKLASVLKEVGPDLSSAIGLAMRNIY